MEREEKIAYWLMTKLLYDGIIPDNVNGLDNKDRKKVIQYAGLVVNYDKLIPRDILDFIRKNGFEPRDIKKYSKLFFNINGDFKLNNLSVSTIKVLLKEIDEEESFIEEGKIKGLINDKDLLKLKRFIYEGKGKKEMLFDGCGCNK